MWRKLIASAQRIFRVVGVVFFGLLALVFFVVMVRVIDALRPGLRWVCNGVEHGERLEVVNQRMADVGAFHQNQTSEPGEHLWYGFRSGREDPDTCTIRFDRDLRAVRRAPGMAGTSAR